MCFVHKQKYLNLSLSRTIDNRVFEIAGRFELEVPCCYGDSVQGISWVDDKTEGFFRVLILKDPSNTIVVYRA